MKTERVIVYVIARMVEMDNIGTGPLLDDWWVDCTLGGSAQIEDLKVSRDDSARESGVHSKTSVSQYHVYYADGGHNRFKERDFKVEESSVKAVEPSADPSSLLPEPEYVA